MFNEMMRAEIWLQDHLESQQGIEDLASRLGYSTSQVRRRFKQCFGLSPSAYRDTLRLEKAARLLAFTPYPIQTIAMRCGYQNHSAFSRAFLRYHNQTPRQYRQEQRIKLYRNPYRQEHSGDPPAFEIRKLPTRQALVTRIYQQLRERHTNSLRKLAQRIRGSDALPERLKQGPNIALMHNTPLDSQVERIDLGPLIDKPSTAGVAIPASFRLLELPAQRHACVSIECLDEIPAVVQYLVSEGLPRKRCFASGEAVRVEWCDSGMTMQLPVLKE
ncbi:helix-turn-helix domain-containing protein [Billgrantia saliphila]|uniref:helix-turn-helix domain-containing protein n=1 Tax=Billgrantia saliphila TaxID=1848458 RepID=UPI000CE4D8AE|nr:AraC family transcriptional regulator [Halomonas saliphila]